ncbi:hypothetical protein CUMW_239330 [Citrus unshiu]|uniref:Uncharacterized protein n=1 Tax=Citrus unshiu TaxID=55188 RepID=A0A2H5QKQ2_CITUN|nr:hypothetical protein CUMW_239330 [Citrus unshiu]
MKLGKLSSKRCRLRVKLRVSKAESSKSTTMGTKLGTCDSPLCSPFGRMQETEAKAHIIKFIVDGQWKVDPQRESVTKGGICNNILRAKHRILTVHIAQGKVMDRLNHICYLVGNTKECCCNICPAATAQNHFTWNLKRK